MMKSEHNLSRKEIEILCHLYFSGDLSREEEENLAHVLSSSDERGGVIDETVFIMGLHHNTHDSMPDEDGRKEERSHLDPASLLRLAFRKIIAASALAAVLMLTAFQKTTMRITMKFY